MKIGSRYYRRETVPAFTLVELLVAVSTLAILLVLITQLVDSTAKATASGSKRIDADTEGRAVLDRIGIDIGRMLKRSDVDYYLKSAAGTYYVNKKGHTTGKGQTKKSTDQGSDQIAFYSQVEGYKPAAPGPTPYPSGQHGSISLVSYRINNTTYQMERMGKNLLWNGVANANGANATQPVLFSPTVPFPTALTIATNWRAATDITTDPDYEVIGPNVFRFEYYYLLKKGIPSDTPWDTDTSLTPLHTSVDGLRDVEAIAVAIAVIDPKSRSLLSTQNLIDLESNLFDFRITPGKSGNGNKKLGDVEYQWGRAINGNTAGVPPAAAQAIRVYSRVFNLNIP
ncbi:MAG: prepilin-type N-terminal cleavage/methylation domain-containing protein [Acidobacteriota bacterium]|nr:prepilin-type N-terminal cleavage/methylation domain-containing protein [Acidobacteriota bacterium]